MIKTKSTFVWNSIYPNKPSLSSVHSTTALVSISINQNLFVWIIQLSLLLHSPISSFHLGRNNLILVFITKILLFCITGLVEGHFKNCFTEAYYHLLCQPLKIRNQGFSNTLCIQLESRVFNVNENYNSSPLCVNILPEE